MRNQLSKPILMLLLVTAAVVIFYSAFEFYIQASDPRQSTPEQLIEESLDLSEELFNTIQNNFSENTHHLKSRIESRLIESVSRQAVHNELTSYPFWGSFLYRNDELFSWEGFTFGSRPELDEIPEDSLYVNIYRRSNVTFLLGKISFSVGEDDQFTLYTTERLEQKNVIPIAREQEYDLNRHPDLENRFPVNFIFFDSRPEPLEHYRKLQTADSDSVGLVYAVEEDFTAFVISTEAVVSRWRTMFHIGLFILGSILFFYWSYSLRSWTSLVLQLTVILFIWTIFSRTEIPVQWIPQFMPDLDGSQLMSLRAISYYAIHSLFTFFVAFSIITTLTRKWNISSPEKHYQTFIYSFFFGAINVMLILFFLITTHETAASARIALLDLELIPNLASWILFIATGFFISSIAALLIAAWWFLFINEKDKTAVICVIAAVSFFLFYFLAEQVVSFSLFEGWKLLLSFTLFSVFIGSAVYVYKNPRSFLQMSGFRLLLLISLLTSAAGYTIYANAYSVRMDEQLVMNAQEFATEEDEIVHDVAVEILSSIGRRLFFLSADDLEERVSSVQSQFQSAIQNSIREEWRRYSFDIQLIDAEGNLIDDYATNFDSPGAGFFNLMHVETSYRQERIGRQTNRPVVQNRPPSLPRDDFTTYSRGWIPIYDEVIPNQIIAWILTAVYIERPDFNKPIRAVLAASTVDDWQTSYYLAEFADGILNRSTVKGIYASQPKYNRLSDREIEIAQNDSIAFISNYTAQGTFRELLYKDSEQKIIKASTPLPGMNNHLFSFFRFNVIILIAGLILFPLFSLIGLKTFNLFNQSRKFQSRLLDGLAMATLLFLVVLIVTTQFAVKHQNETTLQREIITKLDNLADAIRFEQRQQTDNPENFIPLTKATSPLSADAIFYRNQQVTESTTPQIFQQNLLPQILPYPVSDFLYNRERNHVTRTINIGNETLLIGYRLVHSEENEPLGVVAIPTFLQSPLYTEQLLETTSYLLVTYLFIFGIFIIATVLIASQLTKPLYYIQEGLNKISDGDLETTIPVKSQDELGAISGAYNIMVEKLKELQKNLAEAEREAAWKEMAQQVAHEIKNPLTPMKLNLQHLKRQLENEPDKTSKFHKNVERVTAGIIEQIESLNKIASDFSNFAHPIRKEFNTVEVNELITSVAELYDPESIGRIQQNLTAGPLHISGSNEELRRALINLIKNSYEAIEGDAILDIRSIRNGKNVIIEIEDNGAGIAQDLHNKIFVPNFSTKSSGTGLGLAITKKIIEAHEGLISFESEVGEGTIFRIELPLNNNDKPA